MNLGGLSLKCSNMKMYTYIYIGFTLGEKSVQSSYPITLIASIITITYCYDILGYIIVGLAYYYYIYTMVKNKTTPPSYHNTFLLSTVIVGISLNL